VSAVSKVVQVHERRSSLPQEIARAILGGFDRHYALFRQASIDAKAAAWAAGLSQGSIGRALAFLPDGDEEGTLEKLRRRAFEILVAATAPRASEAHALALGFPPAGGRGLVELFGFVEEWLRDLAAVAAGAKSAVMNRDTLAQLDRLVAQGGLTSFQIASAFGRVERARELVLANVNPQLVVGGLVRELRHALARGTHAEATA